MLEPSEVPQQQEDSFDQIALDLQALRENAGHVSYAELVRRITALRMRRGVASAAAIPARSTVYNAFQTGRTRLDTQLLRDIVAALGVDDPTAELWVQRRQRARRAADAAAKSQVQVQVQVQVQAQSESPEKSTGRAQPLRSLHRATSPRLSSSLVVLLLIACVAINLLGLYANHVFKLSVYLDMTGTAIAAIALGPWPGVAVAILSSNLGYLMGDPTSAIFTVVNVAGALLWGYGIHRLRLGESFARFFMLNVGVAACCSLVAVPILALFLGGQSSHASTEATLSLEALGLPMLVSVFSSNIVSSITDKLLVGFVTLLILTVLHTRIGLSVEHMPLVKKLGAMRTGSTYAPFTHRLA